MRILLIDADSKIPNIALMKLSSYHKNRGDEVELIVLNGENFIYNNTYDKAYASIIFSKNKNNIEGDIEIGGVGYSLDNELSYNIEHIMPDYSIYPDNKYSIGYLTRGCCNNCSFCVVPKKEGKIRFNASVFEFMNKDLPKIRILDNNLFAYKGWEKCLDELEETKKRIKFENFDFRITSERQIEILSKMKIDGECIFALDHPEDINRFENKMWMLEKYFEPWRTKFYVLVGYDTSLREDIERVLFLSKHKSLPYIMRHEKCYSSVNKDFYTDLASWCNQPSFFKKMDFENFLYKRHTKQERINSSLDLWKNNVK